MVSELPSLTFEAAAFRKKSREIIDLLNRLDETFSRRNEAIARS